MDLPVLQKQPSPPPTGQDLPEAQTPLDNTPIVRPQSQPTLSTSDLAEPPWKKTLKARRRASNLSLNLRKSDDVVDSGDTPSPMASPMLSRTPALSRLPLAPLTAVLDGNRSEAPTQKSGDVLADLSAEQAMASAPYQHEAIQVLPNLYLGSEKNATNQKMLSHLRIHYILNVGIECRNHFDSKSPGDLKQESGNDKSSKDDDSWASEIGQEATNGLNDQFPLSPMYNPLNIVLSLPDPTTPHFPSSKPTSPKASTPTTASRRKRTSDDVEYTETLPVQEKAPESPMLRLPLYRLPTVDDRLPRRRSPSTSPRKMTTTRPWTPITLLSDAMERDLRIPTQPESKPINVSAEPEPFRPPTYLKFDWHHNQDDMLHYFEQGFAFIDKAREEGVGVLVHCKQGVSRSASLVIAYLMKSQKMSFQNAYTFLKQKSPSITPNLQLIYQLLEFEKTLDLKSDHTSA